MSAETAGIVTARLKHEFDVSLVAWGNKLLHCRAVRASHQDGVDFLSEPKLALERFKAGTNKYCGGCLSKGWAGFTHAPKAEQDIRVLPPKAPLPGAHYPIPLNTTGAQAPG